MNTRLGVAEQYFLDKWREKANDYPMPVTQFPFGKNIGRKWLADFCWQNRYVIVEIQGGTWNGGGHVTGSGYQKDCERMNSAQELGYTILYYTPQMLKRDSDGVVAQIKRILDSR